MRKSRAKERINRADFERILFEGESAKQLLQSAEFNFFRQYLFNTQNHIAKVIIKNEIKDVEEHRLIDTVFKKVFKITKDEQRLESAGRYNMIDDIMSYLDGTVKLMERYEKLNELGRLEIIADNERKI